MAPKTPFTWNVNPPNASRFRSAIEQRGRVLNYCGDERHELMSCPLIDEALAFFTRHAIPAPLCSLLEEHSYTSMVTFGQLRFEPVNTIPELNEWEPASLIDAALERFESTGNVE